MDAVSGIPRVSGPRARRIIAAALVTFVTSLTVLGLIGFARWQGRQAVRNDTRIAVEQISEQLLRTLQSRRGTLTLLRDTLNRQPALETTQLSAMGDSAVQHTRHLLGIGLLRGTQPPVWWSTAPQLSDTEVAQVNRAAIQRAKLRGIWRVPSTFVTATQTQRPVLVMFEPLRAPTFRESAVIGALDLKQLLEDFFSSGLPKSYPVQLFDGQTLLFRSADWAAGTAERRVVIEEFPLRLDAARWTIQIQPGSAIVVKTLSWLNVLLIGLGIVAVLGITVIVWILAARTWILQRAVARRTAALRRALKRVRQLAITDELTGLYNRRFFLKRWTWEWERAKRYHRPLACLMIDVNSFKQVNDRLGHAAGDLVLKQVAQELKTLLRQSDILARFGGDEFVIALPETTYDQAARVAEKLRKLSIGIPQPAGRPAITVSLSVGISHVEQQEGGFADILEAADKSLYAHKRRIKASADAAAEPRST